jgi:hypothetical protein
METGEIEVNLEWHKGGFCIYEFCIYESTWCSEGLCSGCEIYRRWKRLERMLRYLTRPI